MLFHVSVHVLGRYSSVFLTAHCTHKKFFLMPLNQNVIVVMGVEKLNTFMFFFLSLQSWFLWQGLSESTAKIVSWKLEIWQNKHIAAEKEQTADTKRSFSLANTIQSTTTEPRKTPRCPKRTPNSTRFEQEHSSPFAQESSTRLSGQTQNARRKKKMRNCLTHRELSERKHNMANWQMTNYTFVSFFSFFF